MENFNNVYNENYKWVLNLIKSRIKHKANAEEMTNDIFMKVYENLENFDVNKCKNGMVGWLRSITFNKIIDYYRKKKQDMISIQSLVDEDGKETYNFRNDVDIEKDLIRNELLDMGKSIINVLPNPYKAVATLFYIKDYSYDEIVQELNITKGTLKGQLNRARKLIRKESELVLN